MKVLIMQVRREIWEHRSLWIAPLIVGVMLLGSVAIAGRLQLGPGRVIVNSPFQTMLLGWAIPFYLASGVVIVVYLLDCLYGERRDRSILFWRSMPVSDTQAVVAKLLVGLVLVPLAAFLLSAVTSLLAIMILQLRHLVRVNGLPVPPWEGATWWSVQLRMLSGLCVLLLWYAPYATYLMLASVWARRSPYAWAFLPPMLLAVFENILFGTGYIGRVVERGLREVLQLAFNLNLQFAYNVGDLIVPPPRAAPPAVNAGPPGMLASPQLWIGLVAAGLMLLLVIRLRRYRDDS